MHMSPLHVNFGPRVSRFVSDNYQGVYLTKFVRRMNDGTLLYETSLYSVDGPKIYTYVRPDESMVDMTSYYHRGGLAYRR